ncbi:hypothetical protein MKK68_03805 [Methylobacterium sp. E-016]|uniref:hypothetical protein n=1 Tax=Methylobacterium sp. E-016 TaxID=2836556 RepID=UPI001FB9402B|nr:hypothetical protein [Methylobacterium sp. E-016]MCJ2074777.1 hypothetical protein [Methylobacterium sp. E-016]
MPDTRATPVTLEPMEASMAQLAAAVVAAALLEAGQGDKVVLDQQAGMLLEGRRAPLPGPVQQAAQILTAAVAAVAARAV